MNLLLFAVVALLGLLLRVFSLNLQPLWWDEGYSVFFATSDLATMLARTAIDIHPPFYYLLLQSWMLLFGKSAFALRMLSVVIGIVALPVVYLLTKRLYNSRIAFLASALLAISPFHIYYSQEVRMYSLVTLLGLVSVYLFAQLIGMPKGTTRTAIIAALYIVVTTAALYTQYYAVFLLAFQVIYVVAISISRHRTSIRDLVASLAHWAVAWLLIFVLYLPWLVIAGSELI